MQSSVGRHSKAGIDGKPEKAEEVEEGVPDPCLLPFEEGRGGRTPPPLQKGGGRDPSLPRKKRDFGTEKCMVKNFFGRFAPRNVLKMPSKIFLRRFAPKQRGEGVGPPP